MDSWLLILALSWLAAAANVYWPIRRPAVPAFLSFFAGWLVGELAMHHLVAQILVTVALVAGGALGSGTGQLALGVAVASWMLLIAGYLRSFDAGAAVDDAVRRAFGSDFAERIHPDLEPPAVPAVRWDRVVRPFSVRSPTVERIRDVEYGRAEGRPLLLDVVRSRTRPLGAPTLLQIHGGGWVLGSKKEQGWPLMRRLAEHGWVCLSIDYRLSPRATFPAQLLDVKQAIRWAREHAREWGADPDFLVITGGSAGGHLAALAALTANEPEYQPGFEDVDTSCAACVPFYGVYDFTNPAGLFPNDGLRKLLERHVLKTTLDREPDRFHRASPVHCMASNPPPFLVVHGDRDTLVDVEAGRRFHARLEDDFPRLSAYAEIPGAQHAFEIFSSVRTELVIGHVERFLAFVRSRWLENEATASAMEREQMDTPDGALEAAAGAGSAGEVQDGVA